MLRFRSSYYLLVSVLLILPALIGCSSNKPNNSLANFQPEVVNTQDSFSLQATGVDNVSTVLTYTWPNSGTRASIDHSTTTTAGSATVGLYDSVDSLVYTKGLVASSTQQSSAGIAGNWKIVVTLINYSGTLNFTTQKL